VVLIGAGTTFIAGADIRFFETITTREASVERSRSVHARLRRIEDCPKPVVAAVRGVAAGAGASLALLADFRIGGPKTSFLMAFAKVGLAADTGISSTRYSSRSRL